MLIALAVSEVFLHMTRPKFRSHEADRNTVFCTVRTHLCAHAYDDAPGVARTYAAYHHVVGRCVLAYSGQLGLVQVGVGLARRCCHACPDCRSLQMLSLTARARDHPGAGLSIGTL